MNFTQRLKFFGFGFVIGAIILVYILSQKKCRGMNEMKVVELVSQKKLFSSKAKCKLDALKLNDTTFIDAMKNYRVNYALSDIHKTPCGVYRLEPLKPDSAMFNITICDCDTISTIDDIDVFAKYKVNCDSLK